MVTTNTTNYGLIRTVQVRNENIPGVLGALASAIGSAGANIGNIQTVHLSDVVISTAGVPGLIAPEAVRSVADSVRALQPGPGDTPGAGGGGGRGARRRRDDGEQPAGLPRHLARGAEHTGRRD